MGSKVDKPSRIFIKTFNALEYMELYIENIEAPKTDVYVKTYKVPLKEFLKLFKCLASSDIHTLSRSLNLLFKDLHQEIKRLKEIISKRLTWAP